MKTLVALLALCTLACSVSAQADSSASAPLVVGQTATPSALPEGTEVVLRTLTELNSKDARVGDRFQLEVASPVELNGRTVIPAGALAMGEVTKVDKKGMFGKSGKIQTRLLYVRVGDRQVRIRGSVGDRGKGGTAATVGTLLVVWPAAFFVTGKSALLPPGTGAVGHLEADLPVVFANAAAVPVRIP